MRLSGRAEELTAITAALAAIRTVGSSLTIAGGPGAGRTALLDAAHESGRAAGLTVLRCNGSRPAMVDRLWHLHEACYPLMGNTSRLPAGQRDALSAAFGGPGPVEPDLPSLRMAVLGLLEQEAAERPVVLLVDDWQWLDPMSADVLAFAAREVSSSAVVTLTTSRTTGSEARRTAPMPGRTLFLAQLSDEEAADVLAHRQRSLSNSDRSRIIAFARGNPLALIEAAAVVARSGPAHPAAPLMTDRLASSFLDEVRPLSATSRMLLLCAAAGTGATASELVRAGRSIGAGPADVEELTRLGLLDLIGEYPTFSEPLLRTVIYTDAALSDRATVHRALAEVSDEPMQAVRHLAAGTLHQDSAVATALAHAAESATSRGSLAEAIEALQRSADLTPEPDARARRLRDAAELARQSGRATATDRLLRAAYAAAGESPVAAALAVTETGDRAGRGTGADDIPLLIALCRRLARLGDQPRVGERLRLLSGAAMLSSFSAPPVEVVNAATAELAMLDLDDRDPVRVACLAILDPTRHGAELRGRLGDLRTAGPDQVELLMLCGRAAQATHDLDLAVATHEAAQRLLRAGGRTADLAQELTLLSLLRVLKGNPQRAYAEASEAARLASTLRLTAVVAEANAALALSQAWTGNDREYLAAMTRSREVTTAPWASTPARRGWAAGLVALVDGRHREAWVELQATTGHPVTAAWAAADLAEAAVLSGRDHLARRPAPVKAGPGRAQGSDHLAALAHRSEALTGCAADAAEHYAASIAAAEAAGTVLEQGRSHLAYGRWLRRERRIGPAREHLSAAMAVFHTTGAHPWAKLAENELQAAGVAVNRAASPAPGRDDRLTPQEMQIAELAAGGLTNREIADQLLLSHRTIGTHLYRVFTKLSVSDRREVGEALAGAR